MQPSLIVVGLSYPESPVAVRERFWLQPDQRLEALVHLRAGEGVEELALLMNPIRTEFVIWASDLSLAASSVLAYLTGKHGLRLCEWKHFYRLVDETALVHMLRVGSGLESRFDAGTSTLDDFSSALAMARKAGAAGPHLEAVFDGILQAAPRIRRETGVGFPTDVPLHAAIESARQNLPSGEEHKILVLAAEAESDLGAIDRQIEVKLLKRIPDRDSGRDAFVNTSLCLENCWQEMVKADVVIQLASGRAGYTLTQKHAKELATQRNGKELQLFDLAMPRSIDPAIAAEPGFALCNIDVLHEACQKANGDRVPANAHTRQLLTREAKLILTRLGNASPEAGVEYARINQLCREVAQRYTLEVAASEDQARVIEGVSDLIACRISSYLGTEKGPERKPTIMSAVRRLFHDNRRSRAIPEN